MNDVLTRLNALRRPGLLIRAARIGLQDYARDRDLRRLLSASRLPGPREAIVRLMEEEAALDEARRDKTVTYNVNRHVDVMIALLGEAMMARSQTASPN